MSRVTCSYNKKDWNTLSLLTIVQLVLPFLGALFILFTLVYPMIDVMGVIIPELTETWVVEHIRDVGMDNGFSLNTVLLYYVFTLSGGVLIPVLILLFSMGRLLDLGSWFVKGVKLDSPIFYWDGVPFKETKLGSKIKRFDEWPQKSKDKDDSK